MQTATAANTNIANFAMWSSEAQKNFHLAQWTDETRRVFRKLLGRRHEEAGTEPESVSTASAPHVGRAAMRVLDRGWMGCPWSDGRNGFDSLDPQAAELRAVWTTFTPRNEIDAVFSR